MWDEFILHLLRWKASTSSTEGFRQDVLPAADLEKLQVKLAGHPDAWLRCLFSWQESFVFRSCCRCNRPGVVPFDVCKLWMQLTGISSCSEMIMTTVTTYFLPMVLIDITEDLSSAMIACDEDWSIGKPWMLSLTAESLDKEDREFGFAGGEGFLVSWAQWEWSWLETDGGKDQLQKVCCL